MKTITTLIAVAVLLSYGTSLFAQGGTPQQPQDRPGQSAPEHHEASPQADPGHAEVPEWKGGAWQAGQKAMLTGCLERSTIGAITGAFKDDAEEEFILTQQGTEQEISVKGLAALGQHTDHMVQLTGTMQKEDDENILQVSEIKHVANSCPEPERGRPDSQSREPGTPPSPQESQRQ
jgi:hypothetical protein